MAFSECLLANGQDRGFFVTIRSPLRLVLIFDTVSPT